MFLFDVFKTGDLDIWSIVGLLCIVLFDMTKTLHIESVS